MAGRIRTIKPELLEDERTAGLSNHGFRLFVGMLLLADDYGNLRAHPGQLHGSVFWAIGATSSETAAALAELHTKELVELYTQRGQTYGHIAGWDKHQRVDKPGKPRCPKPSDDGVVREIRETLARLPHLTSDLRPPNPTSESDPEGDLRPLASPGAPPAPASAQASDRPSPKPKRPRAEPTGDHHEFIRRFDALYLERTGQKPLWDGKTGRHVAELLKRLPLTELVRRAERLFRDPPHWLAKDVPTMGTLYSQINALADDARPPSQRAGPLFAGTRGHAPPSDASEFGDGDVNRRGGT